MTLQTAGLAAPVFDVQTGGDGGGFTGARSCALRALSGARGAQRLQGAGQGVGAGCGSAVTLRGVLLRGCVAIDRYRSPMTLWTWTDRRRRGSAITRAAADCIEASTTPPVGIACPCTNR